MTEPDRQFVSRGGEKLGAALDGFGVQPIGWVCADLGCNVGGFVDCLLQRGAAKVYAIDTGYGTLAYRLRRDPRVVVMERTNAMHARLPEPVDLVTIDVGWTRQSHILPAARRLLKPAGCIITLIKPHYEADRSQLAAGVLPPAVAAEVMRTTCAEIASYDLLIQQTMLSPLQGQKGNTEYLALVRPMEAR